MSGLTVITKNASTSGTNIGAVATCPVGKTIVGGGFQLNAAFGGSVTIRQNRVNNLASNNAWFASAAGSNPLSATWDITATAICAGPDIILIPLS